MQDRDLLEKQLVPHSFYINETTLIQKTKHLMLGVGDMDDLKVLSQNVVIYFIACFFF